MISKELDEMAVGKSTNLKIDQNICTELYAFLHLPGFFVPLFKAPF